MPRIKDDNKIHQIQTAALKLVIKTGFSGLKMADVAKEAGIATGTLYIYYDSKELLINDLFVVTKQEIANVMFKAENQGTTLYETFKKIWLAYFKFCYQNPEKMLFVEQFLYSGLITDENITKTDACFEPLDEFLNLAKQQSYIKDVDVALLKAHLQGAIHEQIKIMIKDNLSIEKTPINELFDLTWNGVRK